MWDILESNLPEDDTESFFEFFEDCPNVQKKKQTMELSIFCSEFCEWIFNRTGIQDQSR